jgi:hypothetical protein
MGKAAQEEGLEIPNEVAKGVREFEEDKWFCPDSDQPRVRTRKEWDKREKILKRMPFFIYKMVAS